MNKALIERTLAAMDKGYMSHNHAEYAAVMAALKSELFTEEPQMFDYKSEALAYSISLENAELREEQLRQELLATQITAENLRVVTPEMIEAGRKAGEDWGDSNSKEPWAIPVYLAMLEAA